MLLGSRYVGFRYPAVGCGKRQQSAVGSQRSSPISCCPHANTFRDYCTRGGEVSPQATALAIPGVTASLIAALALNLLQAGIKSLQTLSDVAKLVEICWMRAAFQ